MLEFPGSESELESVPGFSSPSSSSSNGSEINSPGGFSNLRSKLSRQKDNLHDTASWKDSDHVMQRRLSETDIAVDLEDLAPMDK